MDTIKDGNKRVLSKAWRDLGAEKHGNCHVTFLKNLALPSTSDLGFLCFLYPAEHLFGDRQAVWLDLDFVFLFSSISLLQETYTIQQQLQLSQPRIAYNDQTKHIHI